MSRIARNVLAATATLAPVICIMSALKESPAASMAAATRERGAEKPGPPRAIRRTG